MSEISLQPSVSPDCQVLFGLSRSNGAMTRQGYGEICRQLFRGEPGGLND